MSIGPASGYYNRPSQIFPFQVAPVTGCDVLAYSCAAARDLHPLPISQRVAGLRSCANLILRKSRNSDPVNLAGNATQSQTELRDDGGAAGVSLGQSGGPCGAPGSPFLIASS